MTELTISNFNFEEIKSTIITALRKEGKTNLQIATITGIHNRTVCRILKRNGIDASVPIRERNATIILQNLGYTITKPEEL